MVITRCQGMRPLLPQKGRCLTHMQQLFKISRTIFQNPSRVPSETELDKAMRVMSNVPLEEMGFDKRTCQPRKERRIASRSRDKEIEYLSVYEGEDFHIGIFCLPSGAVIPLHNHPGMTVMSRLLFGRMQVRSFDKVEKLKDLAGRNTRWKVQLRDELVLNDENSTAFLLPDRANLHMFRALTACAVLDVLAPPYDPASGRHCTYYKAIEPFNVYSPTPTADSMQIHCLMPQLEDADDFARKERLSPFPIIEVEECLPPVDFVVRRGEYYGVLPTASEDEP